MAPSAMTQLMAAIVFATVKFQSDADTIACAAIATPKADNVQAIVSSEERAAQFGMAPARAASTPRGARVPQGATISAPAAPNATARRIATGPVKASAARMMRWTNSPAAAATTIRASHVSTAPGRGDGRATPRTIEITANMAEKIARCRIRLRATPADHWASDGLTLRVSTACVRVTTIAAAAQAPKSLSALGPSPSRISTSVLSPPRSSSASHTGGINAPTATATAMEEGRRDASPPLITSSSVVPSHIPENAQTTRSPERRYGSSPTMTITSTPSDSGACQTAKAAMAGTRRGCRNCCEANGLALSSA